MTGLHNLLLTMHETGKPAELVQGTAALSKYGIMLASKPAFLHTVMQQQTVVVMN